MVPERFTDFGTLLLILMMLNITADLVIKVVFNVPIPGSSEATGEQYTVGSMLFPLARVELTRSSITVDVLST